MLVLIYQALLSQLPQLVDLKVVEIKSLLIMIFIKVNLGVQQQTINLGQS